MLTFRARLQPRSATLSPWQADTLFGHLCWLIRYRQGEDALANFLSEYHSGEPPLLFSDGFPDDWLPRPMLPSVRETAADKPAQIQAMARAKANKDVRWASLADFDALRRGEQVTLPRPEFASSRTVLKNQINRLTGGTTASDEDADGGNLYNVEELAFSREAGPKHVGLDVTVYVKARDEHWAQQGRDWLNQLAESGYGAKKSAGYGHFSVANWEAFAGFAAPANANGFISLCAWTPARTDPTNGFYRTQVKYGKLGEAFANSENPFKFPLLRLTAGSAFYYDDAPRPWYGRLVNGIAPADGRVVQYGYAFAVPAHLPAED
jgi:CRISPR-associated protein Csm4